MCSAPSEADPNPARPFDARGSAEAYERFVDDVADACLFVMREYDDAQPINLGGRADLSIREAAEAGRWEEASRRIDALFQNKPRPAYVGELPPGNNGLGLGLLGISGDQVVKIGDLMIDRPIDLVALLEAVIPFRSRHTLALLGALAVFAAIAPEAEGLTGQFFAKKMWAPNAASPFIAAHLKSLETVKAIPIDGKIRFWRDVMRHARDRGIEVLEMHNLLTDIVANPEVQRAYLGA